MLENTAYILLAYLLGSIPFGLILSNLFGKGNLCETGSKSIGATNVLRTQGKSLGFLTFLLDFLKGFAVCYCFHSDNGLMNSAFVALPVFGHMFPVWLKFNGGKGIATYFGVLCALDVYVLLAALLVWLAVFAIWKFSSLSGLVSVISSCAFFYFMDHSSLHFLNRWCALIVVVVVIIIRHHENIKRLWNNEELKA